MYCGRFSSRNKLVKSCSRWAKTRSAEESSAAKMATHRQGDQEPTQDGPEAFPAGAGTVAASVQPADGSCFRVSDRNISGRASMLPTSLSRLDHIIRQAVPGPAPAQKGDGQQAHQSERKDERQEQAQRFLADKGDHGEEQDGDEQEQGLPGRPQAVEPQHQEAPGQAEQHIDGEIDPPGVFQKRKSKNQPSSQSRDPENVRAFHNGRLHLTRAKKILTRRTRRNPQGHKEKQKTKNKRFYALTSHSDGEILCRLAEG